MFGVDSARVLVDGSSASRRATRQLSLVVAALVTASLMTGLVSDSVKSAYEPALTQTLPVPYRDLPLAQQVTTTEPASLDLTDTSWPSSGHARTSGAGRAGDLPVTVTSKQRRDFAVEVVDQEISRRIGVTGVVVTVAPADEGKGEMTVGIDYSGFRNASGGHFGTRLGLVRLPDCALTTPDTPACREPSPLPSTNDPESHTVTAESLPTERMVLAAVPSASGPSGSFETSSLAPSGSWAVAGNAGSFTWSYPIGVPPVASGAEIAPQIALAYNSSTVDGRTAATNNQSSWIGQGWDYSPGSIERTYRTCASDKSLPQVQQTGDLCWAGQVVTLNLNGESSALVRDDNTGTWRAASDNGARVELKPGASNGVHDGEHWKITATNGIVYYFGLNRGPGYTNQDETDSAWTVPVYAPRPGDPCYSSSGFADSKCDQAWRWNLDFVEDPHGNVTSYYYSRETNHYGANLKTIAVPYTRGGVLKRVDYGIRKTNGSIYGSVVPNQVVFDVAERCLPQDAITCDPSQFTEANAKYWPDTPQERECKQGVICDKHGPSFWSTKRLTTITTQYNAGANPVVVDKFQLGQEFKDIGDKELWLQSITRTGFAKDGTSISTPPISFTGQLLDNRVRGYGGMPALAHWRVTNIATDTGSSINVFYSAPDCTATTVPTDLAHNSTRCYPVYWTLPFNEDPTLDYFHKYVVDRVEVQDRNHLAPTQVTDYAYLDSPAWHFDDNELVEPGHRTYGQYRGYGKVEVRTGDTRNSFDGVPDQQTLTRTTYFRGMDGDTLPGGGRRPATVGDSLNESPTDHPSYSGQVREIEQFNGRTTARISSTVVDPTTVSTTATRDRDKLPAQTSQIVRTGRTRVFTSLAAGGTRNSSLTARFDDAGRAITESDSGNGVPDLCKTTRYAENTTSWIRDRVAEVTTSQEKCSDKVTAALVLRSGRTYFDNQDTLGAITAAGDATRTESATTNNGGTLAFATTATTAYDTSGRTTSSTDALNRTTRTTFTPADGGILSKVVSTNPKGHENTVEVDPGRGKAIATVDIGGKRSDAVYDALGRLTAAWQPGQTKGFDPATATYDYLLRTDGPLAVTSKSLVDYGTGTYYVTKVDLHDGMGQLRQSQTETADGRVIKDVFYDSHGWVKATNNRYFTSGAPGTTVIEVAAESVKDRTIKDYDGAGREIKSTDYKGLIATWNTRTVHGGDRTTTIPPQGGVTTTSVVDVRGQETERRQYSSAPNITGSVVSGGVFQTTTLRYTPTGLQQAITEPGGAVRSYDYDLLGRRTGQTDPDAGTSATIYDLAGQILTTTDGQGRKLAFTYDELGRKTAQFTDSTSGTKLASWTYDGATNGKGKPWVSTRYTADGTYSTAVTVYSVVGKPSKLFTRIPAFETGLNADYTTTYSYTTTGLLTQLQQPKGGGLNGEAIGFTYDKLGRSLTASGYNSYVSGSTYTPYGEAQTYTLGPSNNTASLNFDYDEQTRRPTLVNLSAQIADPQVDSTRYTYDPFGNVTKSVNTQGPENSGSTPVRTQCFGYDTLNRLNGAWTSTDGCSAAPGGSTVGGPTPYWLSWEFGQNGLRSKQVQHGMPGTGTSNTTTNYDYPASDAINAHRLAKTTSTGPAGTATVDYSYDNSGNTIGRSPSGGGNQTMSWNSESKLSGVTTATGTTRYVYDGDGNQLIREDHGKTTLFLPGQELTKDAAGTVVGTRYYSHDGRKVAVRVGGGNPRYVVADRHGTATVTFDSVSFAVTRRTMDPYGNLLGPIAGGPWPGSLGFLDKPVSDATGLTDVGARKYEASTGRFISVDPVVDPTDPLSLTAYGYANSNPITYSDPTGLIIANPGPDGVNGPKRVNNPVNGAPPPAIIVPRVNAPTVQNQELQKIINESYIRPGYPINIGDGSTPDALRYELRTGQQVEGSWHFVKAAAQADRLGKWLEAVRLKVIKASPEDIAIAETQAADHYNALTTQDENGAVTDHIKQLETSDHPTYKQFQSLVDKIHGNYSLREITGSSFVELKYKADSYQRTPQSMPRIQTGIIMLEVFAFAVTASQQGLPEATFQHLDVTGTGQAIRDMPCSPYGPSDASGCVG